MCFARERQKYGYFPPSYHLYIGLVFYNVALGARTFWSSQRGVLHPFWHHNVAAAYSDACNVNVIYLGATRNKMLSSDQCLLLESILLVDPCRVGYDVPYCVRYVSFYNQSDDLVCVPRRIFLSFPLIYFFLEREREGWCCL